MPRRLVYSVYSHGLAGAASLVEPVISVDQLRAGLGALADVFDLFMCAADGRQQARYLLICETPASESAKSGPSTQPRARSVHPRVV